MGGLLTLGMKIYLKYGIRLVLNADQTKELATTFSMTDVCKEGLSSFCTSKPDDLLDEFRSTVKFREDVLKTSRILYTSLIRKCSDCQLVSVHLRMGDYDHHLTVLGLGPNLLKETNYLPQAIHYVKQHYQKPLFYFVSEDNGKMM